MNKLLIVMSITERKKKNWKQHTCYRPVTSQLESKFSPVCRVETGPEDSGVGAAGQGAAPHTACAKPCSEQG